MPAQWCVIVLIEAFDDGFFDGPAHPLDRPVGRGMFDFRMAAFDDMLLADPTVDAPQDTPVQAAVGELSVDIGERRAQGAKHHLDHTALGTAVNWPTKE